MTRSNDISHLSPLDHFYDLNSAGKIVNKHAAKRNIT